MMVREYGRDIGLRIKITNADDDLVVNKTKDHTVMKPDQRRWLMVLHLLVVFHEDLGAI